MTVLTIMSQQDFYDTIKQHSKAEEDELAVALYLYAIMEETTVGRSHGTSCAVFGVNDVSAVTRVRSASLNQVISNLGV